MRVHCILWHERCSVYIIAARCSLKFLKICVAPVSGSRPRKRSSDGRSRDWLLRRRRRHIPGHSVLGHVVELGLVLLQTTFIVPVDTLLGTKDKEGIGESKELHLSKSTDLWHKKIPPRDMETNSACPGSYCKCWQSPPSYDGSGAACSCSSGAAQTSLSLMRNSINRSRETT
jgi:hypothetical protein